MNIEELKNDIVINKKYIAKMKVLIACESSGTVRDAFIKLGHDAISCDLLDSESIGPHYKGDVFDIINNGFDLMIAHPPCTYLAVSGLHWNKKRPERELKTRLALEFVQALMNVDIPHICIENPVSCISTQIRKPDQVIQPFQFGHNASKKTCLWLKNLPLLSPTKRIYGRMIDGKERFENQTDSGQNRLPPSKDRWKLRSKTYEGVAMAMAQQWGNVKGFNFDLFK